MPFGILFFSFGIFFGVLLWHFLLLSLLVDVVLALFGIFHFSVIFSLDFLWSEDFPFSILILVFIGIPSTSHSQHH